MPGRRTLAQIEDMLARADMMALTLGGLVGAPGFQNLGSFDQGDFEHTFEEREVIAMLAPPRPFFERK